MKLKSPEELVLETIYMEQPSPFLIQRSTINYANLYGLVIPSKSEIESGLEFLIKGEYVHIIERAFLDRMKIKLNSKNIHGPIFGWPSPGSIDLTKKGFDCLQKIKDQRIAKSGAQISSLREYSVVVEWHKQIFALTIQALESVTKKQYHQNYLVLHEPQSCMAWQHTPWTTFLRGYQVEIVETNSEYVNSNSFNLRNFIEGPDLFGFFLGFVLAVQPRYLFAQKAIQTELEINSIAEIICLALISDLFGYGGSMMQFRLEELLADILYESPGKSSYDSKAIMSRVLSQKWARVAQTTDVELVEQIKACTTNCISFVGDPVANHTVCLTSSGFEILTGALGMLWGNDKWNDYILGIRDIGDLYYQYYEDYDVALQAIEIRTQRGDHSISGPIEAVGQWCTHWYDVKEQGYRYQLRTIY
ncbi:MAG TPA: hypothetical protein DCM07_29485 [Planctomycetaceae bacterium]|uniref:hypothetical protein n=1 Tax=Gimesia sp. TaxID=2024833 RepID=UPI000C65FDF3|nr:hypothetical protein [Gimesia sp.]MAX35794.1 hypothetical protein [Gimesia sp.]HAH48900.1 hypothetical protein [Planctomycetaceae bacterium]